MFVQDLLRLLPAARLIGDGETEIKGLTADSRRVKPGWLFIAVPGMTTDGHDYAAQAAQQGAAALMVERPLGVNLPQVIVPNTQSVMGLVAAQFHGFPSSRLRVIGITGTKGKTSTSYLLNHMLRAAGVSTSLVGSVGGMVAGRSLSAGLTTRTAEELQQLMAQAVAAGETSWIMEVGSHSLVQRRVVGIDFDTAIFTNLAHDHLDYHGTMERYFEAKSLLFSWLGSASDPSSLKGKKAAIVNADDPMAAELVSLCGVPVISYGFSERADLWAEDIILGPQSSSFTLRGIRGTWAVELPLVGRFNIANTLAALAGGLVEGADMGGMIAALRGFPGVPGRFQRINLGQPFTVIVDYAHTEESLRQVIHAARGITSGKIIVVFGCTGDRDRTKRPLMGALAVSLADMAIISSDDPHSEDPEAIIDEIVAGLPEGSMNWVRQADREKAVEMALELAQEGDLVLLAGKGHETVQVFKDYSIPYSDVDAVVGALQRLGYVQH